MSHLDFITTLDSSESQQMVQFFAYLCKQLEAAVALPMTMEESNVRDVPFSNDL